MKVYLVKRIYDVGAGLCKDIVAVFSEKADAKAFVERHNIPFIHVKPHDPWYCIETQEVTDHANAEKVINDYEFPFHTT